MLLFFTLYLIYVEVSNGNWGDLNKEIYTKNILVHKNITEIYKNKKMIDIVNIYKLIIYSNYGNINGSTYEFSTIYK